MNVIEFEYSTLVEFEYSTFFASTKSHCKTFSYFKVEVLKS